MRTLKKLSKSEMKTVSGIGLLDPVCRLLCSLADSGLVNLTDVQSFLCPDLDCANIE